MILMLTGAEHGLTLDAIREARSEWRSTRHLCFARDANGTLGIKVMPGLLYLDFKEATEKAAILGRAPTFPFISPRKYPLSATDFERALISAGHGRLR